MRRYTTVLSSFMLALIIPQLTQAAVFGWQEKALIQPEQGSVEVELSPTSPKSSIEVHDLVLFQKNGENWARFSVPVMHALTGTTDLTLERKVLRTEKPKAPLAALSISWCGCRCAWVTRYTPRTLC